MSKFLIYKTGSWKSLFVHADSFLISLIGFFLIQLLCRHGGIGVSPDSIAYLSVARNIDTHGLLVDYNSGPLVDFPVFYPFFLSAAGFICKTDVLLIAPWLNGILFAAIIIITGYLINSFTGFNRIYKWVTLLLIALSPSLLDIYEMLWSETLFILLTIVFIATFSTYLRKQTISSLLICAIVAAIACITRYAAVTVIGTGLMMIVFNNSLAIRKRLIHCILFGLVSVSLLVTNLIRNALITGSLTGPRQKGILSLSDNIVFYGRVICQWLPVQWDHARLVSGIAIAILVVITGLFLKRSWLSRNYNSAENCFAAFFIVYTVFIIGISTLSHFEQINNRFLAPLFIPMLIALTSWIPAGLKKLDVLPFRLAIIALTLLVIFFERNQYRQWEEMYDDSKNYGIPGYTDDSWKNSETAKFLREHPGYFNREYTVYSNAHEAAYFNGGVQTESLPQRVDKIYTSQFFEEDAFYLIWFDNFSDNELIKFKLIWDHAEVVKQKDFNDGDIFFIKPHHALPLQQ